MSPVVIKHLSGKKYYYFRYAFRERGKWKAIEQSVGPEMPNPRKLAELQEAFQQKIVDDRWSGDLDRIVHAFKSEVPSINGRMIKDKEIEDFGIKFTYNTNKIEGSSLTYGDVKTILVHGITPNGRLMDDVIEARSHMDLYKHVIHTRAPLTIATVHEWHKDLFCTTKPAIAGRVRESGVRIAGSKHLPPASKYEIENALLDLFEWHDRVQARMHPALLACLVKLKFVTIHPYADGNGRVSRLIMNHLLYWNGYPMFNIEFKDRVSYYKALERAQVGGEPVPFIHWFFMHYVKNQEK